MSNLKKYIFFGVSLLIAIIIACLFYSRKVIQKEVWLVANFSGDKNNQFLDALVSELKKSLPSSPKILIKRIPHPPLNEKNANLIIWGHIKDEKVSFNLTTLKPQIGWIRIDNNAAGLIHFRKIKIIDEIDAFNNDSLLKIFLHGYLKYIGRNYKEAISLWEKPPFSDNQLISFYLGNGYFLLSQRGENVRDYQLKANEYYQHLLSVLDPKENLYFFQAVSNNLGVQYLDSPFGRHKENLIQAQKYLEQAVKVVISDFSSEEYGLALNNLILVYRNIPNIQIEKFNQLIRGNFLEVTRVSKRKKNKQIEAAAYNNFGSITIESMGEKGGEYIEESIDNLKEGKKLVSKKELPEMYYLLINNLSLAYSLQNEGDIKENRYQAIKYFKQSLSFFSKKKFPKEFALISKNIGDLYLLFEGENFQKANYHFQDALEIYQEKEYPIQYAFVQESRGNGYFNLPPEKDESNLREAITYYRNALKFIGQDNFPKDFAKIVSNLAIIYSSLKQDRSENLKKAVILYEKALEFYKKEIYPHQYAILKNNLGNVWKDLMELQQASECLIEALETYKSLGNIKEYMMTKVNLANVYALFPANRKKNLEKAIAIYNEVLLAYQGDSDYYDIVQHNLHRAKIALEGLEKDK